MNTKRFFLSLSCLILFMGMLSNLNAQVSIGIDESPTKGSLLQLKNIENITNGNANANKGLLMPKVKLTSITDLFPMFPAGYDKTENDLPHTGLMVFNVNEDLHNGDGAGIYVWDGEKWKGIGLVSRDILADSNIFHLSERKTKGIATITTIPDALPWVMTTSAPDNAINSSMVTTTGNNLEFERTENIYGNKTYTFTLEHSDKDVDIEVCHINLMLGKSLIKIGESGVISTSAVEAVGGRADWVVKSYTQEGFNWVVPPTNTDGNLTFELGATGTEGTTTGYITVAHIDDPEYIKVVTIEQNKETIVLPEFDYLLIQYNYERRGEVTSGYDVDTATRPSGTGVSAIDNAYRDGAVGWSLRSTLAINGKTYLHWPGDNVQSGYESVYANMTVFREELKKENANREINMDMYATWYNPSLAALGDKNKIRVTITLYKGGEMKPIPDPLQPGKSFDYENIGGQMVFQIPEVGEPETYIPVTTYRGVNTYQTSYTGIWRLKYDIEDNTGILEPWPTDAGRSKRSTDQSVDIPDMLPNETKDEYGERVWKYIDSLDTSVLKE